MADIKYYRLAKDEELPSEFCAVRDVNGEPSEYTFYVNELELHDLEGHNRRLRDDLEFERSENGWAREFLNRMGRKCGTKDCPSLVAYVTNLEAENTKLREELEVVGTAAYLYGRDDLKAENAKLQELVEDMLSCIEIRAAFDRPPTEEMYETFAQRARELGVEVDG